MTKKPKTPKTLLPGLGAPLNVPRPAYGPKETIDLGDGATLTIQGIPAGVDPDSLFGSSGPDRHVMMLDEGLNPNAESGVASSKIKNFVDGVVGSYEPGELSSHGHLASPQEVESFLAKPSEERLLAFNFHSETKKSDGQLYLTTIPPLRQVWTVMVDAIINYTRLFDCWRLLTQPLASYHPLKLRLLAEALTDNGLDKYLEGFYWTRHHGEDYLAFEWQSFLPWLQLVMRMATQRKRDNYPLPVLAGGAPLLNDSVEVKLASYRQRFINRKARRTRAQTMDICQPVNGIEALGDGRLKTTFRYVLVPRERVERDIRLLRGGLPEALIDIESPQEFFRSALRFLDSGDSLARQEKLRPEHIEKLFSNFDILQRRIVRLNAELKEGGITFQQWVETARTKSVTATASPAADAPLDDSLEEALDEPPEVANEELGVTAATVAEARKRLRQQKFDALPDVLEGFDAFQALYAAAEQGGFVEKTFMGTPMVVDRLRDEAIRIERDNDETERTRLREFSDGKISPARALGTVVKGRLVFANKQVFKAMQQRRYSGRAMLRCLGKRPPYILPDIHVLAPHEFGQVPGFVAGQHRLQRDRLCVVMISYDPALWDLSLRERKALIEANKGPKLWVFPRQWLFDLSSAWRWWDAGWFGTPKDPSVLDFIVPDDDYQI